VDRVSREYPKPAAHDTADVAVDFPGEEQGEACVRASSETNIQSKRMPIRLEIAKLAVYLARTILLTSRADFLIDGGVTAIRAWRLNLVVESGDVL